MRFEFKKWGNGSSAYEVTLLTDYNPITKRQRYTFVGFAEKLGSTWIGRKEIGGTVEGKTRKEVAEKLAQRYLKTN